MVLVVISPQQVVVLPRRNNLCLQSVKRVVTSPWPSSSSNAGLSAGSRASGQHPSAPSVMRRTLTTLQRPCQRKNSVLSEDRMRPVGVALGVNVSRCPPPRAHIHGFPESDFQLASSTPSTTCSTSSSSSSTSRIFPAPVPDPAERRLIELSDRLAAGPPAVTMDSIIDSLGSAASQGLERLKESTPFAKAAEAASTVKDGGAFLKDAANPYVPQLTKQEFYQRLVAVLMEGDMWTFDRFLAYNQTMRDLLPLLLDSWERRKQQGLTGPVPPNERLEDLTQVDKNILVLKAMTPRERQSNCQLAFSQEALRLIAEKADCSVPRVIQVLNEHSKLRGDRRWFQIRLQFGRRLPRDIAERDLMAQYDRPMEAADNERTLETVTRLMQWRQRKEQPSHPKRHGTWIYRRPSIGGNRWSTQPPRWFPRFPPQKHQNRTVRIAT
ncbi:unnamed protein product [Amoebophrya sp. A25]|nr:unnamed protein product [Amoebophrya sp. A25]|eukprot:GSA25T00015999001.1